MQRAADEVQYYKLELQNREENYNQVTLTLTLTLTPTLALALAPTLTLTRWELWFFVTLHSLLVAAYRLKSDFEAGSGDSSFPVSSDA